MKDISRERRNLGASRSVIAELAGLTQSAVWRIETGRSHEGEVERYERALKLVQTGEASPTHRTQRTVDAPTQQAILGKLTTVTELVVKARKQRSVAAIRRTLDRAVEEVSDLVQVA